VEHATYGLNALLTAIGTRMATFTYTAPDSAATIAAAVWNYLTASMTTVNSIGKKLADWVVGTIDTYTGNTKQTGDAFALLGTVRGADNDTLKTLSDQLDIAQADLDNPSQYKATGFATPTNISDAQTAIIAALPSVAGLAVEANIEAHVTAAVSFYDPPTRAEATADKQAILDAIDDIPLTIEPVQILEGLAVTMSADLLTVNIDGVATNLTMKQGEAKTLLITVLDADGVAVNLSAATLMMGFKTAKADTSYVIEKDDADFDQTLAASGIVSVDFTETDTDQAVATYIGEIKASWTGGTVINKSADIKLKIKEAVIPAA
jgi:hypothetical protein